VSCSSGVKSAMYNCLVSRSKFVVILTASGTVAVVEVRMLVCVVVDRYVFRKVT